MRVLSAVVAALVCAQCALAWAPSAPPLAARHQQSFIRPSHPAAPSTTRNTFIGTSRLLLHTTSSRQEPRQQEARHCTSMVVTSGEGLLQKLRRRPAVAVLGTAAVLGLAVALLQPGSALAAAKAAATAVTPEEHLHLGQKVAMYCRDKGRLPDWATICVISAMPVVELRGGVPVGLWLGLPIAKVFGLCVLGNMVPIPLILAALRSNAVQKALKPFLNRARAKATEFGDADKQATALLFFVGIPLPGTGAWTGAMIASILGMPVQEALSAIFLGVISAGVIMTALTLAGKLGAIAATTVLAIFCVSHVLSGHKTTTSSSSSGTSTGDSTGSGATSSGGSA